MNPSRLIILCLFGLAGSQVFAQKTANLPYIGYVYPAGGQQGTTFTVRAGGQRIETSTGAVVSGKGVRVTLKECYTRIGNQEMRLLKEQLKILKKSKGELDEETLRIKEKLEMRIREEERNPASRSLATLAEFNITIAPNAKPGLREIRLKTTRGLSNPLSFYVGRIPETTRAPMKISKFQTLGKEHLALRKRAAADEEKTILLPCTVNGQIASGEINRYRFTAEKGQRLVISTLARQLVPYIADAVPGWFQPVITLQDADENDVAFNDDYRFKPDPTLLYEVEETGEYVLSIKDAIYRGREDFVYRMTLGETPFVTDIYPPGTSAGKKIRPKMNGWNLKNSSIKLATPNPTEGIYPIAADRGDAISNIIPFAIDTLPEQMEKPKKTVQQVTLPIIVNGRIEVPGDQDIYEFAATEGDTLVAEVNARRLDSPLDSIIKLIAPDGTLLALNDDHADPASGLNTHHADSYLRVQLPTSGTYQLQLSDTAQKGGRAYTYRLRLSPPRPDFALRTVPSRLYMKGNKANLEVYAVRKDGYEGPINLQINTPGFSSKKASIPAGEEKSQILITCKPQGLPNPAPITITGTATIDGQELTRDAVPSEDWMQAFLWRHLVPSQELLTYRSEKTTKKLIPLPAEPDLSDLNKEVKKDDKSRKQLIGRVKRIGLLYQNGLMTDDFYTKTVTDLLDYLEVESPN